MFQGFFRSQGQNLNTGRKYYADTNSIFISILFMTVLDVLLCRSVSETSEKSRIGSKSLSNCLFINNFTDYLIILKVVGYH